MEKSLPSKIRVLQVQNNYNISESDLAEQIIKGLPEDQFAVTTAFLKKKPDKGDPVSCAGQSVFFDFKSSQLKGIRRLFSLYRIYKFCKEENFDVVICHRFKPTHIFLLLNVFLNFRRCISVTHGIGDYDRSYRQSAVNRWIRNNWTFVGVSRSVQDYLIRSCKGLTTKNTVVVNNAIDIKRAQSVQLERGQARTLLGINNDCFIFGTIGRLVPVKGHKYLIEAAALLAPRYPNMRVVIIGGGREEEVLKTQIHKAGLEGVVILSGWKDDALQYVKAFDVFVLPSLSEGLPISLLEAMSGGVPTIGSDIPSIKPVIEKLGLLAKPENTKELAGVMEEYLKMESSVIIQKGTEHLQSVQKNHNICDYRNSYRALITPEG